MPAASPTLKRM